MYKAHPVLKKCVPEHEIPSDCIGIRGRIYQTSTIDHPGGSVFLKICTGCDATPLYESHHLDIDAADRYLAQIPHVGTYVPLVRYEYGGYRTMREAARRVLPSRQSRGMSAQSRRLHLAIIWASLAVHAWMVCSPTAWKCVLSALLNSVCGALGHNAVHRVDAISVMLDWNGLSCYEWLHEHAHSHHMYVNTVHDHDVISMEPYLFWMKARGESLVGKRSKHLLYAIAEMAVALQGNVGHRMRWSLLRSRDFPLWMRLAPFAFLARVASHIVVLGVVQGLLTFFAVFSMASFYFASIAHMTHAKVHIEETNDFAKMQMDNTIDICAPGLAYLVLLLDRQRLHHLFPAVDHTRLPALRGVVSPLASGLVELNRVVNDVLEPRRVADLGHGNVRKHD